MTETTLLGRADEVNRIAILFVAVRRLAHPTFAEPGWNQPARNQY